jgi:acyl carrier protein
MTRQDILTEVARQLGGKRPKQGLDPADTLSDLGVTSFELLKLIVGLRKTLGGNVPPNRFRGIQTVADLCALFEVGEG